MKKIARCLFALVLVALGCTTNETLKVSESLNKKSINGESVVLSVVAPSQEWNHIALQLKGELSSQILQAGIAKRIAFPEDQKADYEVSVTLTSIREISGVGNVMLGVMGKSNKISGDVTVVHLKTKNVVKKFSFDTESAPRSVSSRSDIREAVKKAAELIVSTLQ